MAERTPKRMRDEQPGLWDPISGPEPATGADAEPDQPGGLGDPARTETDVAEPATEPAPAVDSEPGEVVRTDVVERVTARECAACGGPITMAATGRPAVVCSHACRQRRWALRAAAAELDRPTPPEPRVVREIVERTITRTEIRTVAAPPEPPARPEPAEPAVPERARDWQRLLGELAAQLRTPDTPIVVEHWHHQRLQTALAEVLAALDRAHPGGLHRTR